MYTAYVRIVEEPPPPQARRGIVTASVLNVRARPGVSPDNPVIDQLVQGTEVSIYEDQPVAGVPWYRIGTNRWVHSVYVRLIQLEEVRDVLTAPGVPGDAVRLPVGWVVSSSINVRARPGVSAGNPVIGEVFHNQRLNILESTLVSGARWYRIGIDRWAYRPVGGRGHAQAAAGQHRRKRAMGWREPEPADLCRLRRRHTGVCRHGGYRVASYAHRARRISHLAATAGGRMSGGSVATGGYYYLEEVTWTCFFYSGYALHTAYWHDPLDVPAATATQHHSYTRVGLSVECAGRGQ